MKITPPWERKAKSRFTRKFMKECENLYVNKLGNTREWAKMVTKERRALHIRCNKSNKRNGRRFAKRK